jgi:hypothetical protein
MRAFKLVVFTNAAPDQDDDFNRWYEEQHAPNVLEIPGFTGVSRYTVSGSESHAPAHRYLALYDIETDDPNAVMQELSTRVRNGQIKISDAMDRASGHTQLYECIMPYRKS